jgi:hypothetical protein
VFESAGSRVGRSPRALSRLGVVPLLTRVVLQTTVSIPNNTFSAKSWLAADIARDDVGAWSALNATRFTVVQGITQLRITLAPSWAASSLGDRWCYAQKNADSTKLLLEDNRPSRNEASTGVISLWLDGFQTGDYFEVVFAQTTGAGQNLTGSSATHGTATKLQIEWAP